jgi:hypothetical protein
MCLFCGDIEEKRKRLYVLADAYKTEFKGNIKGPVTFEDASAWADDYPDIFREYLIEAGY